ncbi:hypothetical protein CFP56_010268 [Quercus suber]|uniref:Uncharacterized protein n=1 Tax=Quercus suber TaxID=58331 RepID=A0AAW0L039_QUESU
MSSETEETAMASLGMKKRKRYRARSQSPMIMTTSPVSSLDSSASQLHTHENVYSSRKIINNNKLDAPNNKSVQVEEKSFIIEKRKSNNRARVRRGVMSIALLRLISRVRRGGKNRVVVLSPYFANQRPTTTTTTMGDERIINKSIEIDLGFDGNARGRRKDSRRYTYTQQDLEDEDHKMESDCQISSPLEGSLQNETKDGHYDEEQEKNFSFPFELTNNSFFLPDDGGRNLAAEVENEAVMLPSIYANLKEYQLQQTGLEIGKLSHSKRRRRNGKQQAIAHVDIRKVSPYFANEEGPKVEETFRNKNTVISKHSRTSRDIIAKNHDKIRKTKNQFSSLGSLDTHSFSTAGNSGDGNILLTTGDAAAFVKNFRGDGDPKKMRKDKKRGKRKDDRISKECTKSNEILGFEKAVLVDEDVGLTEGFDGNAKGRRKDSRHYMQDFHKMVVKDEEREMEDEEQKMELDYKIKRRTSPFEGSLQNECLKLEDVLSQYTYRSHDMTKNRKNGQHDEEQEKKCSEKLSFPFEMTNIHPNLTGKVENEAVILPSIHTNLKEEQVPQNGLEIGKVSHSKWRRRNEKQQAIAHVEIRKVSPYFWRSRDRW